LKVLGATTTYYDKDGKLMLHDSAWEAIKRLDVKGIQLDWILLTDNPFDPKTESQRNLAYKLEKARKIALSLGYDFLFLHEHDISPPPDALGKLLAVKGDLVTGLYRLRPRHGVGSDLCLLTKLPKPWVAFDRRTTGEIGYDERKLSEYKMNAYEGKTFQVDGAGLGCLLISRRVLKSVPFKWVKANATLDVIYASMVKRKRFKFLCEGSVQCDHEDEDQIVYKIGEQYWAATLIRQGGVWKQLSQIKPIAPLKEARLHLGPRPAGLDWINYDIEPIKGVKYSERIDKLRPRLPFEDDFFTEIVAEGFAEKILDKALLLKELWRVSKDNAQILLTVLNDECDPAILTFWHPRTFEFLTERFSVESRSSNGNRVVWSLRSLKGR